MKNKTRVPTGKPRLIFFLIALAALIAALVFSFRYLPVPTAPTTSPTPIVESTPEVDTGFQVRKNLRVPMRDGVELSTDLYLPRTKQPVPAILVRNPYGKEGAGFMAVLAKTLAEKNVAFVMQDCRGRYQSGGVFEPFRNEAADGADTLDWLTRQRWFNGHVGLIGFSYLGYAAWAAATQSDVTVDLLIPVTTTVSPYRMVYERGVLNYIMALDWAAYVKDRVNRSISPAIWFERMDTALIKVDDVKDQDNPLYNDWVNNTVPGAYWARGDLITKIATVDTPVLFIAGWYDILLSDQLNDFITTQEYGSNKLLDSCLMIGPWSHGLQRKVGDMDFGPRAGFGEIANAMFTWFETYLDGESDPPPPFPKVMLYVMGANRWRGEDEWPLARTRYTRFYFHSAGGANSAKGNGYLTLRRPNQERPDRFIFDPQNPVSTQGGNIYPPNFAGPVDQKQSQGRKDVLVYTSAPLEKPLEITGPIRVRLYASSTAVDTDFTAKLSAVHTDGKVFNLQDGIIRARFRDSLSEPSLLTPNKVSEFEIDLWATSYVFSKGQQIRVEISSSNCPRFDVNRNTGKDPATDTRFVTAHQTVYHSEQFPSHILLPVVPMKHAGRGDDPFE